MVRTNMCEIFDIVVDIGEVMEVCDSNVTAKLITFTGSCQGDYFNGKVLPGGVDRQLILGDGTGQLSARYMLEGTDAKSQACRVFIDNIGTVDKDGCIETMPVVYTDSQYLQEILHTRLFGKVAFEDGRLHVHIYG